MANYNKVLLIGRLTRDPELRYTPAGSPICKFGLAVNRQYTLPSGERKEETCFVDCTQFGKQGETIAKYLKKGNPLFLEGRLSLNQWEDRDGNKRSKLEVICERFQFLGGRGEGGGGEAGGPPASASAPAGAAAEGAPPESSLDDDFEAGTQIPF